MYPMTDHMQLAALCEDADTFGKMAQVMLAELAKFPEGAEIGMAFGPITTGGRGSPEENLRVFEAVIARLRREGRLVFSQMPYEPQLFKLTAAWRQSAPGNSNAYCWPVLKETYLPLFESNRISLAWFIPGWESSQGAAWEREVLMRRDTRIVDLSPSWVEGALLDIALS